ncbi:putative invertase inhibitor [Actinidia eriantha]|uniref:putative invertase inhibitor n=1 Tax=Actinidia eriantha TaxID=165200 RepID=UPI002585C1FB|nr:putative invertase inhibitor [Actinidia eriantha]
MRTFLPFSLLFLSLLAFRCASGQTLIQDTCKACSEQDSKVNLTFCATSLEAAPDSGCASDLPGLGMISMGLVRRNVTSTRFNIKQLLKNKQLDPYVRQCLNDCFDLYSDATLSIKEAMKHYKFKRYIDANFAISSIMDASTTCEQGFQEKSGVISPLTKRNNDTFQLSAMTLFMIHILQSG